MTESLKSSEFIISFGGFAVRQLDISIKDMLPAMLAVSNIVERANSLLNNNYTTSTVALKDVDVHHALKARFHVALRNNHPASQDNHNLFSVVSVEKILQILGFISNKQGDANDESMSLLELIKQVGEGHITDVKQVSEDVVDITTAKGEIKNVYKKALQLYSDPKVRLYLEKIIFYPISQMGVEYITLQGYDSKHKIKIDYQEKKLFKNPTKLQEIISENVISGSTIAPVFISFKKGIKWKFKHLNNNNEEFFANIGDAAFYSSILSGDTSVSANSLYNADIKVTNIQIGQHKSKSYNVIKISEKKTFVQESLF